MKRYIFIVFILIFFSGIGKLSAQFDFDTLIIAHICEGESFNQFGFDENREGIYSYNNRDSINDIDSIYTLELYVHENYYDSITAFICEGETYTEYGFDVNQEGVHTQELNSIYGCDSIIVLDLYIMQHYHDTIYDTVCLYQEYYDFIIDSAGVYIIEEKTIYGCDSITTFIIETNPVYYDTIEANIYKGNVYKQFGFEEDATGIYTQELKTYLGCDSIIYLDLQVDNVMFPNVVTPNGDGINDVFKLHNLVEQNAFPENELIIFNRQGKIIYQKSNIKADRDFWDPQETNTPDGTYFYRFTGVRHDKKLDVVGTVDVMR